MTETTTLRVPVELRDEIAQLARARGATMLDVVTEAIARLRRELWWESVQDALDGLRDVEAVSYQAETATLDGAAARDLAEG